MRLARTIRSLIGPATAILVAGLAFVLATANAQNLLTDLGPGGANGLNNSGQVVLVNGIYSKGAVTPFPATFTGVAINASGEVAGILTSPNVFGSCATYSNGIISDLGVIGNGSFCVVTGINASGQVVGSGPTGPYYDSFFPDPSTLINTFPGSISDCFTGACSSALGVNDSGQVTGSATKDTGFGIQSDAFIYDSVSQKWTDIGPGQGNAINASAQVAGVLATGQGFIYSSGTTTIIPIQPLAINATGQVVGGNSFYSGAVINLNDLVSATDPLKPFVTLTNAVGINDYRLIVVNGTDSRTNLTHGYLVLAPWIDVTPGPLTYPSQPIGTVSSPQTATLTNAGTAPLPLDSISTSGDFSQTNKCGASLAPGAGCAVIVTFGPTLGGDRTGSLTVTSVGVPIVVPLAGTAPITLAISSTASSVTAGTPVKLTWTASPGSTCTATGGSVADKWTGTVAASDTQYVTESTAGRYSYGLSCTSGSQSKSTQTTVVVSWPALTVSLTASPTTINSGNHTTLTWASANAKTCVASGGGTSDGWAGTMQKTSGSATITEVVVVVSPLTLTYTLTCSNSGTGQATPASVKVVLNPPANAGGGGTLNPLFVLFLAGVAAMRRLRQSKLRDRSQE